MGVNQSETMVSYSAYAALWDGEPPFDDLEQWLRVNVWTDHRSVLRQYKGAQASYYRRAGYGPVKLASVKALR